MKATLIFSLFFFILRANGQINLDTFYIFDFYQKQPEGLGGMYPGKIGCDSIVVTINSKVVVLKAINATHSSNDFAVKATMEGLRIVKPKDYEKGLTGAAMFTSPEEWYQTRWNLVTTFPAQTNQIVNLFEAYYINP